MMHRSPRYQPKELLARLLLQPNGDHVLEVSAEGGLVTMKYSMEQVELLGRAIEDARAEISRADGGPDFYNPRVVLVGAVR